MEAVATHLGSAPRIRLYEFDLILEMIRKTGFIKSETDENVYYEYNK